MLRSLRSRAMSLPQPARGALRYLWLVADGERPRATTPVTRRALSRNPTTYRQKMMYKLARDRRPLIGMFADKVAVRDYVSETVGASWLKETFAVADRAADLPWDNLPREVVLKVSHGSGGVILVTESAEVSARLPSAAEHPGWSRHHVHPDSVTRAQLAELLDHWLSLRYGRGRGQSSEWAYTTIEPRILAEEFIGSDQDIPGELWVHCFDGRPGNFVIVGRGPAFEEVGLVRFLRGEEDEACAASGLSADVWDAVVAASAALARTTDAVRVDWLISERGPLFGELTNYPGGGRLMFTGHPRLTPQETHDLVASMWTVPKRYV
ncbi:MAG: hypothetical protein F2842_04395 [Actinobacteria bacterium]|nr:hypothetical protein [Actinomycetota bacterium]